MTPFGIDVDITLSSSFLLQFNTKRLKGMREHQTKKNWFSSISQYFHNFLLEIQMELNFLPEGCIAHILSLTSPRDACRFSLISPVFLSAVNSDVVWESFLPFDYKDIISRSCSPLCFSSKRELYFQLCNPIRIDGGKMTFSIEKSTGKKCYMLSARELSITWGNDPMYWTWKSLSQSRFSEVVELRTVCWLEILGKINTNMLSPNTNYAAYLIVKISERAYGLDALASEISVETKNHQSRGTAYLCLRDVNKQSLEKLYFAHRIEVLNARVIDGEGRVPMHRDDGWMEIELGEFLNEGGDGEVKMSLMEVKGYHLKGGLIVEGIEVRPKCS